MRKLTDRHDSLQHPAGRESSAAGAGLSAQPFREVEHPALIIDLRYATADNLTGQPIYARAVALLHADAHAAMIRAADLALAAGHMLILYDAFRPVEAQRRLWERLPDPTFVGDPALGSPHNRGVAVDLTLADRTGQALDMGTGFDVMETRSYHGSRAVSVGAQANRRRLLELMQRAGWEGKTSEWWHYNLPQPERYPIRDDAQTVAKLM